MERQDPLEGNQPDHAAQPEQTEEGFAEGVEADLPGDERTGRFSEGVEMTPETPDKNLEGNFAEGVETDPSDRYAEAAEEAAVREATDRDNPGQA